MATARNEFVSYRLSERARAARKSLNDCRRDDGVIGSRVDHRRHRDCRRRRVVLAHQSRPWLPGGDIDLADSGLRDCDAEDRPELRLIAGLDAVIIGKP